MGFVRMECSVVLLFNLVEHLDIAAAHSMRQVKVSLQSSFHASLLELHSLRDFTEQQPDNDEPFGHCDGETLCHHWRLQREVASDTKPEALRSPSDGMSLCQPYLTSKFVPNSLDLTQQPL
jgi:hypothetical protein